MKRLRSLFGGPPPASHKHEANTMQASEGNTAGDASPGTTRDPEQNDSIRFGSPDPVRQASGQDTGRVPLLDPGLHVDDPRQGVHNLLEACGVSVMLKGARPIEDVLREAIRCAPILADSSTLGRGFMRLNSDQK